jgi:hypothetical protein
MTSRSRPPKRGPRLSRQSRKRPSERLRQPASASAKAYGGSHRPTVALLVRSLARAPFHRVPPHLGVPAPPVGPARRRVPAVGHRRAVPAITRSASARVAVPVRRRPEALDPAPPACRLGPARPRCRRGRAPRPCRASVPAALVAARRGPAARVPVRAVAAGSAVVPAVAAAVDSAVVPAAPVVVAAPAAVDSAAAPAAAAVPVPVPAQASAVVPAADLLAVVVVPAAVAAVAVPRVRSAVRVASPRVAANRRSSADKSSTTCPRPP